MSLRQLTYAVELANAGSFRRAAENLNITHAALVHSIRALEEHYGVRLFDRGRGVKAIPTEIGAVFLEHARQMLLYQYDLEHDILLLKEPGLGNLDIAFGPFPNEISGKKAVGRLISRYPALSVKMSIRQYRQVVDMIQKRRVDIGVAEMTNVSNNSELELESLGNHLAGAFCRPGHPLLKKNHLTMGDLIRFPWCCTRMPSRVKEFLPSELRRAGHYDPETMELIPAIEIEAMSGLIELAKESDMLCLSSLIMHKNELRNGELALLPYHEGWLRTSYGFISLKNRSKPPVIKEFMAEVRTIEKELFREERELAATYLKCAVA